MVSALLCNICVFLTSIRRHTSCVSAWSSDVCSSDLKSGPGTVTSPELDPRANALATAYSADGKSLLFQVPILQTEFPGRSEESRVGKECRSRRSPYH